MGLLHGSPMRDEDGGGKAPTDEVALSPLLSQLQSFAAPPAPVDGMACGVSLDERRTARTARGRLSSAVEDWEG
jgi:hypothetical protein